MSVCFYNPYFYFNGFLTTYYVLLLNTNSHQWKRIFLLKVVHLISSQFQSRILINYVYLLRNADSKILQRFHSAILHSKQINHVGQRNIQSQKAAHKIQQLRTTCTYLCTHRSPKQHMYRCTHHKFLQY